MRIISGTSKGRRLAAPKGLSVRPTSDRVKESIFNILGKEIEGKIVLDLFAGTGNLGIEALSRGAMKTIFVEKARQALRIIQKNLLRCGFIGQSEVIPKDIHRAIPMLEKRGDSFDFIFMDPPYEEGLVQKTLKKLQIHPIYHQDSILIIEHGRREPLPKNLFGWKIIRQRMIGDTLLSFLRLSK
ncbi:MAG: 16S rRNA (guanine(966)-N(2))-methyltransferase RsmD [Thermodesulfobacteriota bacterium]